MSLRAVQNLLKGQLDGVQTVSMKNQGIGPIACFVAPPQAYTATLTAPAVYLWGGEAVGHRTTAPSTPTHSGGFKRNPWRVDAWLMFVLNATPEDDPFPVILDAIRQTIEQIPYPQTINDPDSLPPFTQLVGIGERIETHQELPVSIDDQSNLLVTARMIIEMIEDYQA